MNATRCWLAGVACALFAGVLFFFYEDGEGHWLLPSIVILLLVAVAFYAVGYVFEAREEDPDP